jgi:CspA family cold shock protein
MAIGTVKVVTDKGYGFIGVDGSPKDIFFHENSLTGELATRKLRVGDQVEFDIEESPKGKNAVNIKLVE